MTDTKKISNVISVSIFLQAIIISVIYLYTRINKWNISEALTIFIYPIYSISIMAFVLTSCMVSLIYFAVNLVKTKKIYSYIPILINILAIVIAITFFNENKLREYNFLKYEDEREHIINLIERGELQPNDSGRIEIPEHLQNEEIARNGYVQLISYTPKTGVYFCTFSGLLETSSGYIYFSDKISTDKLSHDDIILFNDYGENWYFSSTN